MSLETKWNKMGFMSCLGFLLIVMNIQNLLMELDRRGFAVSSGSACTSGKTEASHVLKAMAVPNELAISSIRVSLGRSNTLQEVDAFIEAFKQIIEIKNSSVMMAANL